MDQKSAIGGWNCTMEPRKTQKNAIGGGEIAPLGGGEILRVTLLTHTHAKNNIGGKNGTKNTQVMENWNFNKGCPRKYAT